MSVERAEARVREMSARLAELEARMAETGARAADLTAKLDECRKEPWTKRLFKKGGE